MTILYVVGYTLAAIALVAALSLVVTIVTWAAHHIETFFHKVATDKLNRDAQKKQNELNAVRVLKPTEGRSGIVYNGSVFRNMDSSEVFSMELTKSLDPVRYQLDAIQRTLLSMKGISIQPQGAIAELMSGDVGLQGLPEYISLEDAMRKHNIKPSINNVYLGESLDGPVMADFETCTHILLSSGSGWGKSTELESLAKQLVLDGNCQLCFVDYGINTFSAFEEHSKYSIADTPAAAVTLFQSLIDEANRRKELMREFPRAKTIGQYNELSGNDEKTIVVFIDEGASLFVEQETKKPITMLAQMSRKVAIFLVAAGTDWKASTIDSSCTSNFSTRIAMHLMPGLSRSLINCTDAYNLDRPGRALVLLPGRKLTEMQCPQVTRWDDLPSANVKQVELFVPDVSTLTDRVKEVVAEIDSVSVSAVCRALDMKTGGSDFYKIKDILTELDEI